MLLKSCNIKKLVIVFSLSLVIGLPMFAQDFSQQFQKTIGGNGNYRSLGFIGFPSHDDLFRWGIDRYMNKETFNSSFYPSVITGEIWTIVNVINVPESIMKVMIDTTEKNIVDGGYLWEFIFPHEMIGDTKGYLVVLVYAQETWGWLDCAQAFFIGMK